MQGKEISGICHCESVGTIHRAAFGSNYFGSGFIEYLKAATISK